MVSGNHHAKAPAMNWPLASHFSTMLQNPKVAFRDPQLKAISIERDDRNQPRALAGTFANVYKGIHSNGDGPIAVRVFTSGAPERRERYQFVSDYVAKFRLASLVLFNYTDDGIRSTDGRWYPLMTMEWVSGQTLYKWLQEKCSNKQRKDLERVSILWIDTIKELLAAKIAHGDLQHGNVMVTDRGKLKLVDYDCMCVPDLVGRRNLEIGVKPYQHPLRNEDTQLTLNLDNYSALLILVALKALAAAPDLWGRFVEGPQYDKILFREEDFQDPNRSELIRALRKSPDAEVQRLSQELVELTQAPIDQVPPLPDLLFSFAEVESLLNQRDYDAAVELLARGRKQVAEAPSSLQPRLQDAIQRIHCRCSVEAAVQDGDEEAMQRLYQPKLLDDYPKAHPSVAIARNARLVIPVLSKLNAAAQTNAWREFVKVWDASQSLLNGRKSTERMAIDVHTWRQRNDACDCILKLLQQSPDDGEHIESAWTRLVQLGGHPEAEPQRSRVEAIIQRHRAWVVFQGVPRTPSESSDNSIVRSWNEALFAGWNLAERERPRVVQAQTRLSLVSQLSRQSGLELSLKGELGLVKLSPGIPEDYQFDLRPRLMLARKRIRTLRQMQKGLKEPASDVMIERAWNKLRELDGRSLLPSTLSQRIDLALRRAPLVRALKRVSPDYPPQEAESLDSQLLAIWNVDLLADCRDADPWRQRYTQASSRKVLLEELKSAIGAADQFRIADLAADPVLHDYPLPRNWTAAVQRAVLDVECVRKLLAALQSNRRLDFGEVFDVRIVRRYPKLIEPHQDKIREWMQTEVLPLKKLGLTLPTAQRGLEWEEAEISDARCKARWNWPKTRFGDLCLMLICPSRPTVGVDLHHFKHYLQLRIDRKSYEEGGGSRNVPLEHTWQDGYVVVAALLDLGFDALISEPLVLGRLESPRGRHSDKGKYGELQS